MPNPLRRMSAGGTPRPLPTRPAAMRFASSNAARTASSTSGARTSAFPPRRVNGADRLARLTTSRTGGSERPPAINHQAGDPLPIRRSGVIVGR